MTHIQYAAELLTPADCLPRMNPTKLIPSTDDHELACLKKGLKDILWGFRTLNFEDGGLNEKEWNNGSFSTLKFNLFNFDEGVKGFPSGAIIYRKTMERNALLLEKYLLENDLASYSDCIRITTSTKPQRDKDREISKLTEKENAYIVGMLLEYGEENCEYYYQYRPYINEHYKDNIDPASDADVQANAKKVQSWAVANPDKWKTAFDNDKNAYKIWMSLNADIPNVTLRKQNEALSSAIAMLNYNLPQ